MMSPSAEEKLFSLLMEIQSDIRQIKSDIQSLVALLEQQQQKPTPMSATNNDMMSEPVESKQSGSPEDILRYLQETRGKDDTGE